VQYMILIYEPDSERARGADPAQAGAYWGAWTAYSRALAEAGIMVGGAGLQPHATATTLRVRDGRRHVQDGPYADTKEQLGGYFVIEAPDLDGALEWAARCPVLPAGAVEVRPVLPPPPAEG
jgi:hypothetical protein